ncbi:SRPBCC domain-containing protein [Arthrobacter sp. 08Y14]|uniref:SRPBCC domain-containing protein n=1 Tax=Arthrobacter sp. 08Y14 TaxID=2058885 RepID=UPI000CE47152|nr:SRPBCC domain-containing protein [Arthrobacter sp. 08Y14]
MPLVSSTIETVPGRVALQWSLPAPADRVWWGLTDPEALPQWMGSVTSGKFAVGSVVTVEHAKNYSCISEVLDCEPQALLAMTWKFPDEPLSYLRIELTADENSTRLALTHDALGDEAAGYLPGWQTHLLYLEGLLLGRPRPMADFWQVYGKLDDAEAVQT